MGGSAFNRTFYTPRLPPEVYVRVRDNVSLVLKEFFVQADSPVEAPGKTDHGDIDFIVRTPKVLKPTAEAFDGHRRTSADAMKHNVDTQAIHHALHGMQYIQSSQTVLQFAIPWPDELLHLLPRIKGQTTHPPAIQLDVQYVTNDALYEWMLLTHSHGDLWPIIGSLIRPFGLAISTTGLHLLVPELENEVKNALKGGKEASRVCLTASPDEALSYLDLSGQHDLNNVFESINQMFSFICTCRFFEGGMKNGKSVLDRGRNDPDSRKAKQRPIFRSWHDTFLPTCEFAAGSAAGMSRTEVVDDALQYFPAVREEYERKLRDGLKDVDVRRFWLQLSEEIRRHIEAAEQNQTSAHADKQFHTNQDPNGDTSGLEIDHKSVNIRLHTVLRAVKRELTLTTEIAPLHEATDIATSACVLFEAGQFDELRGRILYDWRTIEVKEIKHEKERYIETLKRKGKWRDNINDPPVDNA